MIKIKRKSGNEIKKEINSFIENSKTKKELFKNIELYLNGISGKELINRNAIETQIYSNLKILKYDRFKLTDKDFLKLFPILHNFNKGIDKIFQKKSLLDKIKDVSIDFTELYKFIFLGDIIFKCDKYKEKRFLKENYKTEVINICKADKTFIKIFTFLEKNNDVSSLLFNYVSSNEKYYIIEFIKNGYMDLTKIYLLFDYNKNIKENSNEIYNLLEKKYSRTDIQNTLIKLLNKKKSV